MTKFITEKLLDFLIDKGIITDKDKQRLLRIISEKGLDLQEILIKENILSEDKLLEILSDLINVPYVKLSDFDIPNEILNLVPLEVAKNNKMIPFARELNTLKVGMVNPLDVHAVEALDFLAKQLGLETEVFLILEKDFQEALNLYHSLGQEIANVLKDTQKDSNVLNDNAFELTDENIKTAPVSKVVSVILRHAVEIGASDVHIEPNNEKTQIRYRIDGVLHTSLVLPLYMLNPIISRIKVLAHLKLDETRIPQDGRIKINIDNHKIDLRVSTLPLLEAEKVSMRVLDSSKKILDIRDLGFLPEMCDKIEQNLRKPYGLILVTGPTGSGKTTTLYSLINKVNSPEVNIVTLEDPIEYEISGVNQSQINPGVDYTFANGLRSILRQDPDIIMVGEIRDIETAEMAIHAGLTGHLLFSTLHTNNAIGAIPRLIDMKVEPFLLASSLNAIIAQRLVRKICEDCKVEYIPDQEILSQIQQSLNGFYKFDYGNIRLYKGKGCKQCGHLGYKGRIAIGEILEVDEDLRNEMNKEINAQILVEHAKRQKMLTMQQDGFIKCLKGITTFDEVIRVTKLEN